ncbi:hypothetical protein, partial [Geomonas sp. Red276]
AAGSSVRDFREAPASSLRSPPHIVTKPKPNGPSEATTILTQGGIWGYAGYQALARGVVTPKDNNKIILFVTEEKQGFQEQYRDRLTGNRLEWEGPTDHFAEGRMVHAARNGDEIHVFHRIRHHMDFTYLGEASILTTTLSSISPSRFTFGIR